MSKQIMLTTYDNPHDPFDDFPAWYAFDVSSGYNTAGLLARIVVDSDQLSEADQDRAIEVAIEEIVRENVSGVHRKVEREVED
jgi:hypothetical protein